MPPARSVRLDRARHVPSFAGRALAAPAAMSYFLLAHALSVLLDLTWLGRRADHVKDIEILLLRQQLRILQHKQPCLPRSSRWDKLTLLVLMRKLTTLTNSARATWPGCTPVRTGDIAQMAPRTRSSKMDLQEDCPAGTAHHQLGSRSADSATGKGEPDLGLWQAGG